MPKSRASKFDKILELTNVDLCCPVLVASFLGIKYFLLFINNHSKKM
uniref:Uncharacterized protein n=2 Tax=Physcomitrium patens TaxID=3218 RepID=A0A2K1IY24_PHYPA|nr:hypothetical protein PHYPA_023992 [Physcomitrium patens]